MHHVLKITTSANNTLVEDLVPLPSTNATHVRVRVANLLGSYYELSTLKLIYTGCTAACTLSDSFILHRTTDWWRLFSSYFHVRTHYVASDAHVKYSRACVIFIYFSSAINTFVPGFLPLPTHQRHVRVANQPV